MWQGGGTGPCRIGGVDSATPRALPVLSDFRLRSVSFSSIGIDFGRSILKIQYTSLQKSCATGQDHQVLRNVPMSEHLTGTIHHLRGTFSWPWPLQHLESRMWWCTKFGPVLYTLNAHPSPFYNCSHKKEFLGLMWRWVYCIGERSFLENGGHFGRIQSVSPYLNCGKI